MNILETIGHISSIFGVLGGLFAFFAWIQTLRLRREMEEERKRLNEKVRVVLRLSGGQKQLSLPVELRRAELTRAELLGRLGMIPMRDPGGRFSLNYLNETRFLRDLERVQNASGEVELAIPCTEAEMNQFAVHTEGGAE